MPDTTRVYDGVGRMFVLNDVPTVRKNLEKKQTSHKEKIAKLEVRNSTKINISQKVITVTIRGKVT